MGLKHVKDLFGNIKKTMIKNVRYVKLQEYGFQCKCNVCSHQINFIREKNKMKFESFIEEFNDLYNEKLPDKAIYRNIKYLLKFMMK